MKRTILTILSVLFSFCYCMAQEKQINEALTEGRGTGKPYHWENRKGKMLKPEKLKEYARSHQIVILKYTSEEVGRFGDVATSVSSVDFIPKSEMAFYVYENMIGVPFSAQSNQNGTVFFFSPKDDQLFQRLDDVLWTGQIRNGRINGNGYGAKQLSSNDYVAFMGTFVDGILQGTGLFRFYHCADQYGYFDKKGLREAQITTGNVSEGLTWVQSQGKYGYINNEGLMAIQPMFDKAGNFQNGEAQVALGNVKFRINKQGQINGFAGGQDLSYDDLAGLAKNQPSLKPLVANQLMKKLSKETSYHELLKIQDKFPSEYEKCFTDSKIDASHDDVRLVNDYFELMLQSIAKNGKGINGKFDIPDQIMNFGFKYSGDEMFALDILKADCIYAYIHSNRALYEPSYSSLFTLFETYVDTEDYMNDIDNDFVILATYDSVRNYFENTLKKIERRIKQLDTNHKFESFKENRQKGKQRLKEKMNKWYQMSPEQRRIESERQLQEEREIFKQIQNSRNK
ncbi:MAG: WG repeat-containing protein [Prevotella sp.]|nr:WG repeat-containing protein [Prevotella sp.]